MPMSEPCSSPESNSWHSGAAATCESTGESLSEPPKGKSTALKRVALKNAAEKCAFVELQRRLEIERRCIHSELSKEQRDVKGQLQRLQQEKSLLADLEELCNDDDSDVFVEETSTCSVSTDPYPVTITPRLFGSRSSRPTTGESDGRRPSGKQSRKTSADLSDMDIHPAGRLPPLLLSSSRTLSPWESSVSNLSRADSTSSVKSLSPKEPREFWAGTPEAISSVRRARRTPSQQRYDHQWSRSQSLKERTQRLDSVRSMSRSSSVKEWRNRLHREGGNASPNSTKWAGSRSLRESQTTLTRSIDSMTESLAEVQLGSRQSLLSPDPVTSGSWGHDPDGLVHPVIKIESPVPLPPIGSSLQGHDP
ncbi:hypothetical protein CAPTEDRAFT_194148 [Capitella teleta]|uniref:Cytohesin Ubiquitin Protein Inducing domain-containing protein n=1 Tax=Capitella teleta TaxID=283909 RepID=R7TJY9_CAPTE|nr:hypothetical protein CAPTEDRAFT_194148 [Capitella teleta]|eukprot:ELT91836.1 hypothetical protein CAPTEDRAFT_194148 [Capitella teleta]